MTDDIFIRLRETLDTLPNGYPKTDDGIEIKILKKIFSTEEAEIAAKLKLEFKTPEEIAQFIGMDKEFLAKKLREMQEKGQISGVRMGDNSLYRLMPFLIGIYELQLNRMDKELAELTDAYLFGAFGEYFLNLNPPLTRVIPIEEELSDKSVVEPYESIRNLIEDSKSWGVGDCLCKKKKRLLGKGCDNPIEVCLFLAPIGNFFEDFFLGRPIAKKEAYQILDQSEEAGLVHVTQNFKRGHFTICNCCSCCCFLLKGMKEYGWAKSVAKSNYVAVVDESQCTACGMCEDRCQIDAVEIEDSAVINEKCIGCGLCVSTCPENAISLKRKDNKDLEYIPENEKAWREIIADSRGIAVEYQKYLKY